MTVLSAPLDEIDTAVLTLLRVSGRPVYDGSYGGNPTQPDYWYAILYPVAGGDADPTPDLEGNPQTVTVPYQVTTVADTRKQARKGGRICHDLILGKTGGDWAHELALPAGWKCVDRRPDPAMPGVDRTGDFPQVVFSMPARYLFTVTPA